jgi:hypothetical protein
VQASWQPEGKGNSCRGGAGAGHDGAALQAGTAYRTQLLALSLVCCPGTLVTPFLIYKLCPPEITDTPEAPKEAAKRWGGRDRAEHR